MPKSISIATLKNTILLLLVLQPRNLLAQNPDAHIGTRMKNFPVETALKDLKFTYAKTDTVTGYEILMYHKTENKCSSNLIFIDDTTTMITSNNLFDLFTKAKLNYNFLEFSEWTSIYSCLFNEPDTFYYCNDKSNKYEKLNFDSIFFDASHFYVDNDNNYFKLFKTEVIIDRFSSANVKYAKYFYHFIDDFTNVTKIKKIHYRQLLKRTEIIMPSILNAKRKRFSNFSCVSIFD